MIDWRKIKKLRKEIGATQEQMAKAAGFPFASTWADVESGRRANVTIETLDKMADALGVKPEQLVTRHVAPRGSEKKRGK